MSLALAGNDKARGFGDDDVHDSEGAAGRNVEPDLEVAAGTLDDVRHDFTDSFRLNRPH